MQYLKVKNWEEFQHYKDRSPPWIKLHRDLLRDYNFNCLQDASKLQLMLIWLLASQMDNKIPADAEYIKQQLCIKGEVHLKELIDKGFLIDDSGVLAECKQLDIGETEAETEAYSKEKEKKKEGVLSLPVWLPVQDWNDYLDMRNSKGKGKATIRAKELILSKLNELYNKGHDPSEVLKQSIINGWTGIFEIKEKHNGNYNAKSNAHDNVTRGIELALSEFNQRQSY